MKKVFRNSFAILALSSLIFTSCSSDDSTPVKDDTENPGTDFVVNENDFKGTINSGTVTLDGTKTYQLTGSLIVNNGAKLVIPAGTTIIGTGGTSSYIAVAQGGKIEINGTANNPVVMTGAEQVPGNWGGLVICGKAPINKGATATAEVSELTYGGTDVNDNSGVIRYLRVEYSGYAYNADKEFNGLSMFGVGKGTVIDYVQVHDGSDDGFEWFGGTVDASHLIVTNYASEVGDDLFDWTEGWNGTGENWYGIRTNDGNRGIEADNNANNEAATPISNPTIKNLTLIGNNGGSENHAIKLRVGTKGSFDNVVLKNWGTGFDVQAAPDLSAGYVGTELKATNVKFENVTTTANATATGIYTENANATGAGNGTNTPAWAAGWTVGL